MWEKRSADAAEHDAQDEAQQGQRHKDIFAEGVEPLHNGFGIALLNRCQCGVLFHDPEVHEGGGEGAQRAQVDGNHVHPLRGPGLNEQGDDDAQTMDDGGGGDAAHVQLFLQEGHRCLKQVDDGADACEENSHEEENADDSGERAHAVEHRHEVHKHQAWAAVAEIRAYGGHGGDDDQHGQQSRGGIEQSAQDGGLADSDVLAQIGTVDDGTGACDGQREEALTKGEDPDVGICQALEIQREDVLVAVRGAGHEEGEDRERDEEYVQSRDHDLTGPLNAAGHAQNHDEEGGDNGNDNPEIVGAAG